VGGWTHDTSSRRSERWGHRNPRCSPAHSWSDPLLAVAQGGGAGFCTRQRTLAAHETRRSWERHLRLHRSSCTAANGDSSIDSNAMRSGTVRRSPSNLPNPKTAPQTALLATLNQRVGGSIPSRRT
jgi:hypothetical protein